MPNDPPSPDTSIADGRYVLKETLGEGGFARVYRAWDNDLLMARAVKILVGPDDERKRMRERLKAEARAMARVGHPNVLRVYDVGTDNQFDYVVMELAEGGTLADRVEQGGPLSGRDVIAYGLQILGALDAAHQVGIIHRDVKPSNVLIDRNGTALLGDFGIALVDWAELPRHTRTGATMGTLAYMAPEQRLDARTVGPAADVYAVGTTLYHLLTGATPFDLFMAAPTSPRWADVPEPLREVLLRAVQYEPTDRYQSAAEMAAALSARLEIATPDLDRAAARPEGGPIGARTWPGPNPESTDRARTLLRASPLTPRPATMSTFTHAPDAVVASMGTPPIRRQSPLLAGILVATLAACTLLAVAVGAALPHGPPPPPSPAEPATPTPRAALPLGVWTGTFNGQAMELHLGGKPEHPEGTVLVRFEDGPRESAVTGRYDAAARRLVLSEGIEAPDGGEYSATIDDDGASLRGTWDARHREQRLSFAARRR